MYQQTAACTYLVWQQDTSLPSLAFVTVMAAVMLGFLILSTISFPFSFPFSCVVQSCMASHPMLPYTSNHEETWISKIVISPNLVLGVPIFLPNIYHLGLLSQQCDKSLRYGPSSSILEPMTHLPRFTLTHHQITYFPIKL